MKSPNDLSFLPDDYLRKKAARRATVIGGGLFLVVTAGIAGAAVVNRSATARIQREHDALVAQYTEAARRIEQVKVLQDNQRRMAQQAELTASLLEKVPRGNLLADITNSLPAGTSLLDFTLESRPVQPPPPKPKAAMSFDEQKKALEEKDRASKNGPPPPQPKKYDVYLKMTGIARTDVQVAQFIAKLGTSKLLKDVNLVITDEYKLAAKTNLTPEQQKKADAEEEKLRKFQIECMVDPAAQVTAADAAKERDARKATAAVELGAK